MRTLIYAAIVAASVTGIAPAIAGEGEGIVANTQFTQLPGVIAETSVPDVASVAMVRNGSGPAAYVTQTSPGIWLFQQYDNGGDNH